MSLMCVSVGWHEYFQCGLLVNCFNYPFPTAHVLRQMTKASWFWRCSRRSPSDEQRRPCIWVHLSNFLHDVLNHWHGLFWLLLLSAEDLSSNSEKPITVADVEPLVKDFASRWKAAIELMHKDVITSFSNFLCGMEILRAALTQLLLYYTRLSDYIKRIEGGSSLNKDLVSISSIMYEIKKYSRTF